MKSRKDRKAVAEDRKAVAAAIEHNVEKVMRDGPGLSYEYKTVILARDRARQRVLIGGLGGMGNGRMWFPERPGDENRPGYVSAPDVDSFGKFGTAEFWQTLRGDEA